MDIQDGLGPELLPAWYEKMKLALQFPLGWKTAYHGRPQDSEQWRADGLAAWTSLLLEHPESPEPQVERLRSERRNGYRVDFLEMNLGPFRRSQVWLAVPDGTGPFPAALVLHDHGAYFALGAEKMIRPFDDSPRMADALAWAGKNYGGVFIADELAARGYMVLVSDALGWGNRACPTYESQQTLASNLFNLGSSWAGLIAVEDMACAAFLANHPQVDAEKVFALGHSMGGYRSSQVTSLSRHIKAGVAICCTGTLGGQMVPGSNKLRGQSAFSMTHPGLARILDYTDMAGLAAPKPLLMIHGSLDKLFPQDDVELAYGRIGEIYRGFGYPAAFEGRFFEGGHAFDRNEQAYTWNWLSKQGF